MLTEETINKVNKYASNSPLKEICGFIDSEGELYPIANVSSIPTDFIMSRIGYGRALKAIKLKGRTVKCVYHSHLDGNPTPSKNDLEGIKQTKLDYLIVANGRYSYTRYYNE